ncbi:MAG: BON domain-containing protein, partial [Candidatus Acidiferrales bacterium]
MRRTLLALAIQAAAMIFVAGCSKVPSDAALATNIKAAMFSDAQLKGANIDVSVSNGVATLNGSVANSVGRDEAEKVASQAGANMVDDQITVQVAEAMPAAVPAPTSVAAPASAPVSAAPSKSEKRARREKEREAREIQAASESRPVASVGAAPIQAPPAPQNPP